MKVVRLVLVELYGIVEAIWLWHFPFRSVVVAVIWQRRSEYQGYINFTLELDSTTITNKLNNNLVTNMKLKKVVDNIKSIKNRIGIQVTHCFREGNQVADWLAKLASTSTQILITQSLSHLPRQARGFIQLDK